MTSFSLVERKNMKRIDRNFLKKVITQRLLDSHKGNYGRLLLIGGTYPYGGAIIMAALAAVNSGSGLVTVATDRENIAALHAHLPEAMAFDVMEKDLLTEQIQKADIILIGPGLNDNAKGQAIFRQVWEQLQAHQVLIVDGGAISLLTRLRLDLPAALLVFTPHQKEWERLSGLELAEQTEDNTKQAVERFPLGTIIVQKRNGTRIWQTGQEDCYQLDVGGPYQATGGMGDTLAGMIAGFAGQFPQVSLYERVVAATYLHSAIAEELSQTAYVVLPTSISREIPKTMKEISK